jgi:hypothetical protein
VRIQNFKHWGLGGEAPPCWAFGTSYTERTLIDVGTNAPQACCGPSPILEPRFVGVRGFFFVGKGG